MRSPIKSIKIELMKTENSKTHQKWTENVIKFFIYEFQLLISLYIVLKINLKFKFLLSMETN